MCGEVCSALGRHGESSSAHLSGFRRRSHSESSARTCRIRPGCVSIWADLCRRRRRGAHAGVSFSNSCHLDVLTLRTQQPSHHVRQSSFLSSRI